MAERLTQPQAKILEAFRRVAVAGQNLQDKVDADNYGDYISSLEDWDRSARSLLKTSFTGPSPASQYPSFFERGYYLSGSTAQNNVKRIQKGIGVRLRALRAIEDMLDLYEDIADSPRGPSGGQSPEIFIIHGHSDVRHEIARFLKTTTSAEPIMLAEQVYGSAVIIESLEIYAKTVKFAIALFTGDDVGRLVAARKLRRRARQNVIFELGFFIAALGRSRVAVLYEEDIEHPSDIDGVLCTPLDAKGAWKFDLARALRNVEVMVDLNMA